jgi:anti-sigma factor RsiW
MPHVDEGTLHAYLDGELSSAEAKTLDAHVAECMSCRAMLVEERALRERASALLGAARPPERAVPPFEQLSRARTPKRSPWRVHTPVAWAASIALALGLGHYLHQPAGQRGAVANEHRHGRLCLRLPGAA